MPEKWQSVRGVSFDIESGKTTALVGESGCGKSVTSKALMGLIERPGVVKGRQPNLYEGKNILDFKEKEWLDFRGKECSMIFQDALVSPDHDDWKTDYGKSGKSQP